MPMLTLWAQVAGAGLEFGLGVTEVYGEDSIQIDLGSDSDVRVIASINVRVTVKHGCC